jgi:hypothetical protein
MRYAGGRGTRCSGASRGGRSHLEDGCDGSGVRAGKAKWVLAM